MGTAVIHYNIIMQVVFATIIMLFDSIHFSLCSWYVFLQVLVRGTILSM